MPIGELIQELGEEIQDPEEETFILFSQPIPSQNLGFVDAKARNLDFTISRRDLSITQSPGLLSSDREGGTTGAVVWKITPLIAEWISYENSLLFKTSVLHSNSQVLELGCGVSGLIAMCLSPMIGRYIATDQDYVFKLMKLNIEQNALKKKVPSKTMPHGNVLTNSKIEIIALDWELNSVSNLSKLIGNGTQGKASQVIDAVVACDCIYNEALIEPFVRSCAELTRLAKESPDAKITAYIIAQQLRSDLVFGVWLSAFHKLFRVWRVPDHLLTEGLRENSGFVVHIGLPREGLT